MYSGSAKWRAVKEHASKTPLDERGENGVVLSRPVGLTLVRRGPIRFNRAVCYAEGRSRSDDMLDGWRQGLGAVTVCSMVGASQAAQGGEGGKGGGVQWLALRGRPTRLGPW